MITVESRPERFGAVQWHQPGDAADLGEISYRVGTDLRHGLHSDTGLQRIKAGDWIVVAGVGWPRVYSPAEFHHKFNIIEEGTS